MTKSQIKDSILKYGWVKTFDNLSLEDRKLFVELVNEHQSSISDYMPFGMLEA